MVRDSAVSAETYFSQHVRWLYNDLGARGAGGLEHLSLCVSSHNPVRVQSFTRTMALYASTYMYVALSVGHLH